MMQFEVNNRVQLVAAIRAIAQPTFEKAHENPARIQLGTTQYNFPNGIQERRANTIVRNIMRTTAKAFNVPAEVLV